MVIWKTIVQIILNGWNKMKKEIWRDVVGYENLYQTSNLGRARSLDRWVKSKSGSVRLCKGKILKPGTTKDGYLKVCLCKNGKKKNFRVHRLVAEAFIPNPYNLPEVNHKDENKLNNNAENLEWCDRLYNVRYGTGIERVAEKNTNGKLSKSVLQFTLDGEFVREWESIAECGRNGYNQGNVAACCQDKRKSHHKFIWRYK